METGKPRESNSSSAPGSGRCLGAVGFVLVCLSSVMPARGYEGSYGASERHPRWGHDLVIDGFKAALTRLEAVDADGVFPITAGATAQRKMIGGERDVQIQLQGVQSPGARPWLEIANGLLQYHQDASATGSVIWHYDTNDGDPGSIRASTGLGGIDLTRDGAVDRFAVRVFSNASPIDLSFVLFSDVENASEMSKTVAATSRSGMVWFPFAGFIASGGNGADLTAITAIAVVLGSGGFTGEVDIVLSGIAATAGPRAKSALRPASRSGANHDLFAQLPGAEPVRRSGGR